MIKLKQNRVNFISLKHWHLETLNSIYNSYPKIDFSTSNIATLDLFYSTGTSKISLKNITYKVDEI